MFAAPSQDLVSVTTPEKETKPPKKVTLDEEQEKMQEIARRLRRAKRTLLLKSVEEPVSPIDQLRIMLMHLSSNSSLDTDLIKGENRDAPVCVASSRSGELSGSTAC